ncbi:MAG TPA: VIT1/CCC1 transporter family protein [Ignavibacteriaceae bacterium]|nr:VIT1/CCC1 transporter family protein [Ignavibacteriaceae bacterium]
MEKLDRQTISTWRYHLQDEIDAAFLYRVLAGLIKNEKRKKIYLQLAGVEDKHVSAWKDLLVKNEVKIKKDEPTTKAKIVAWFSNKFGPAFLTKMMLQEEATEVKSYLGLYKDNPEGQTGDIALRLARDSAEHANKLMDTDDVSEEPWHSTESGGILRNVVYGFNDGLTANFGLIAGVIGASAAPHLILISGLAGLIADALSMGSSGYLAAVSEKEVFEHEKRMERDEIKYMPELETEELALIYESKGMNPDNAKKMAVEAMKNPEQVLDEKIREELGMVENPQSPFKEGWITGLATAIGALIPVFPFFFWQGTPAIVISFIISMTAHFGVGAARSFFTGRGIFRSGFDMFVVGFGVAAVGYFIGELILKFL